MQKNGKKSGKQQYRCKQCLKQFLGGERLNSAFLWQLYSERKQTKEELAKDFGCSSRTIARYLNKHIKKQ